MLDAVLAADSKLTLHTVESAHYHYITFYFSFLDFQNQDLIRDSVTRHIELIQISQNWIKLNWTLPRSSDTVRQYKQQEATSAPTYLHFISLKFFQIVQDLSSELLCRQHLFSHSKRTSISFVSAGGETLFIISENSIIQWNCDPTLRVVWLDLCDDGEKEDCRMLVQDGCNMIISNGMGLRLWSSSASNWFR